MTSVLIYCIWQVWWYKRCYLEFLWIGNYTHPHLREHQRMPIPSKVLFPWRFCKNYYFLYDIYYFLDDSLLHLGLLPGLPPCSFPQAASIFQPPAINSKSSKNVAVYIIYGVPFIVYDKTRQINWFSPTASHVLQEMTWLQNYYFLDGSQGGFW